LTEQELHPSGQAAPGDDPPGRGDHRQRLTDVPLPRHQPVGLLPLSYPSVLLDAGESIKALSEYLGHSDPGFTLRTYTHLMPNSEQRTRQAVDRALSASDGLTTAQATNQKSNRSSRA
jgi:hypothetical protein